MGAQVLPCYRVPALIVSLLCVVATLIAADEGPVSIALNVIFWLSLFAFVSAHGLLSRLWRFLPLTLLYYLTFYFNREVVEMWDKILNSDTPRYLLEATTFRVQTRHLGFPVMTFPYVAVNRLGSTLFGVSNGGREFLYLQLALAGTLGATLVHALLLQHQSATRRWLQARATVVAYLFALSFAVWALSSVIDTFIVSTMLLLMFVLELRHFFVTQSTISCVTLALITVVALSMSLENAYFIGLFGVALTYQYIRGQRRSIGMHCVLYMAIAIVVIILILQIAAVAGGPDFYRTSGDDRFARPSANPIENLYRYTRRFVDFTGAISAKEMIMVSVRVWVMGIAAQHGTPVDRYSGIDSKTLTRIGNLVYLGLIVAVVLVSVHGLMRRLPADLLLVVMVLIATVMIRYGFLLIYARAENVLFATPSIAAFWLLIGLGLNQHSEIVGQRQQTVIVTLLIVLAMFLLMNNGYYLLHIA